MKNQFLFRNRTASPRQRGRRAFSLVEVVLALAICTFSLVVMLGMLSEGLAVGQDTREQMQAANLASLLVSARRNSPTTVFASGAVLLPPLTNTFPATATTTYVNSNGQSTNLAQADYQLSYRVGTITSATNISLIYLRLTWPPGANASTAEGRYELTTQVLLP